MNSNRQNIYSETKINTEIVRLSLSNNVKNIDSYYFQLLD